MREQGKKLPSDLLPENAERSTLPLAGFRCDLIFPCPKMKDVNVINKQVIYHNLMEFTRSPFPRVLMKIPHILLDGQNPSR